MNYTEIKTLAYAYADRDDAETQARYDDFLKLVESKVNRAMKVREASDSKTYDFSLLASSNELDLPVDYGGMRNIFYFDGQEIPMKLASPSRVSTSRKESENFTMPFDILYYIEGEKINCSYELGQGGTESVIMSYYKKAPPLTSGAANNWLSDDYPDVYTFGVRAEIAAFVKNMKSAAEWEARMEKAIGEIVTADVDERWGGDVLQMRTE